MTGNYLSNLRDASLKIIFESYERNVRRIRHAIFFIIYYTSTSFFRMVSPVSFRSISERPQHSE